MRKLSIFLTLAIFGATPAPAHDFWIEPSTFRPEVSDSVFLRLKQGEHFVGEPVARDSTRIEKFVMLDAGGEHDVPGLEGQDPAGFIEIEHSGLILIGYRTNPKLNEPQVAAAFEKYLRDEGLTHVIRQRARGKQSQKDGSEIFSRSAKSLLMAGQGAGTAHDQPLRFRFEIIPLTNPYSMVDGRFSCRLLFDNKPVKNAQVVAYRADDPSVRLQARTRRNGRVNFRLTREGVWLIKSVHMTPAPSTSQADWESIWASLTFFWELPAASSAR